MRTRITRWRAGPAAGLLLTACLGPLGCLDATTLEPPTLGDADLRILFIGNSLTYSNDLPGAVATIAGALGRHVAVASVARPNFALEDHWYTGIGSVIDELRPDVVIMQQGPSSLESSRLHLIAWSDTLSRRVRAAGGEPMLLMVWPSVSRIDVFDDVRDSYQAAAQAVDGLFIPAGEGLRALYDQTSLPPFGGDGFHPSPYGTLVAGYVVVGSLLGVPVRGLPARLEAANGGRPVSVDTEVADQLQAIADSVVSAWR
ncbi:MAG: hypothetical protein R3253_07145 [Longimicrobiales bacterium]|nr:hypothetical protein [Longimicrobiales bacterium]